MKIQGAGQGALLLDDARAAIDEILAALGRKRMYGFNAAPASVAGQQGVVEVNNPAANTTTAYFFMGDVEALSTTGISVALDGATVTPASAPVNLYDGGPASLIVYGTGNQASVSGTAIINQPSVSITQAYLFPQWFWLALPPGKFVQFQASTAAAQFRVNVRWIELAT